MGNLGGYPNTLLSYFNDDLFDPHRNLLPLTDDQRTALRQLRDHKEIDCRIYGEENQAKKQCKRLKAPSAWTGTPPRNHITEHPAKLELRHIIYMLFHNVQLPAYRHLQLCHLCVDPYPTAAGNRCIEITHLMLGSPDWNKDMRICQTMIRNFAKTCRKNPEYRTLGIIYLEDVPRDQRPPKHKDHICNHGCFGIVGEYTG